MTQKKQQGILHQAVAELVRTLPKGTHLTAQQVYQRAQELGLAVSLATVYRTLHLLQASGNVTALSGDHGRRYEAKELGNEHYHLICLKCGLTIEFADDLIAGFGKTMAERKSYEHKNSSFDILGLCNDCKSREEGYKVDNIIECLKQSINAAGELISAFETARSYFQAGKIMRGKETAKIALERLEEPIRQVDLCLSAFE